MRALLASVMLLVATSAHAQRFQPELRVDAYGPGTWRVAPAAGVNVPLNRYMRVGYSASVRDRDIRHMLLGRFSLDPYMQSRWGLSVGGGLTYTESQAWLTILADLEGPKTGAVVPFVQGALGGGPRVSLGMRRAQRGRR